MARIEGSEVLTLSRAEVWRRLNDPGILAVCIPGCRGFEQEEDKEHSYRTAITVAAGAVKGVYEGTVAYLDVVEPERCTIVVEGRGDKGSISGNGAIVLTALDPEQTEVGYTGTFKLTGPVAGVGQRLAPGISRKMIVETLLNLERQDGEPEDLTKTAVGASTAGDSVDVAFRPFAVPTWGVFAAGLVVGAVAGLLVGSAI